MENERSLFTINFFSPGPAFSTVVVHFGFWKRPTPKPYWSVVNSSRDPIHVPATVPGLQPCTKMTEHVCMYNAHPAGLCRSCYSGVGNCQKQNRRILFCYIRVLAPRVVTNLCLSQTSLTCSSLPSPLCKYSPLGKKWLNQRYFHVISTKHLMWWNW